MGKVKSKKRKRSASESSSSSSSSSTDSHSKSSEKRKLRELKKKLKKEQRKTEKALRKKLKKEKHKMKRMQRSTSKSYIQSEECQQGEKSHDVPIELMEKSKAMAPMTKEEWEKRQSVIRRVVDEETGRQRLIKGDGEVLEEIVSKDRHKQINRLATQADGNFFQAQTAGKSRF